MRGYPTKQCKYVLSDRAHQKAKRIAETLGLTASQYVEYLILSADKDGFSEQDWGRIRRELKA